MQAGPGCRALRLLRFLHVLRFTESVTRENVRKWKNEDRHTGLFVSRAAISFALSELQLFFLLLAQLRERAAEADSRITSAFICAYTCTASCT